MSHAACRYVSCSTVTYCMYVITTYSLSLVLYMQLFCLDNKDNIDEEFTEKSDQIINGEHGIKASVSPKVGFDQQLPVTGETSPSWPGYTSRPSTRRAVCRVWRVAGRPS